METNFYILRVKSTGNYLGLDFNSGGYHYQTDYLRSAEIMTLNRANDVLNSDFNKKQFGYVEIIPILFGEPINK